MPIAEEPDSDVDAIRAPELEIPNASDERKIRRLRDRVRREEEEARAFWKAVLASETGRRELWRILDMGHAFEERFAIPGDKPPEVTWLLAGEQRLAFKLYRMWQGSDFDGVALMHRENDPLLAQAK